MALLLKGIWPLLVGELADLLPLSMSIIQYLPYVTTGWVRELPAWSCYDLAILLLSMMSNLVCRTCCRSLLILSSTVTDRGGSDH